jgi:hypothetical protein
MAVLGARGQTGGKQKTLQARFDNASEANKKRILARQDKEIARLRKKMPKPDSIVGRRLQKLIDERPNRREDFKKNPLKIDNKGLKPNVQVKKKTPVKNKVKAKTETRAEMLKRKTGSTFDPTKANRAGQRMGQRKAGGTIKKMRSGGMPGDLNKDGTMSRYEEKRQSAIEKSMAKQGKKGGGLMAAIKKVDAKRMYGGGMTKKKMYGGGMTKKKMMGGGMTKKKMMGGGMTVKKMKHGGKAGKCPRDGIAMRGKTKAGRKTT